MFSQTARYYDRIYAFKNYEDEVARIRGRLRAEHPAAKSVLDVACGTGEHARLLARGLCTNTGSARISGDVADLTVDGIDLEPEFVQIAKEKVPAGRFEVADMRNFALDRRYDAVLCLFSSIGYLLERSDIVAALTCFKNHLAPGGVVMVEPWIRPSAWLEPRPSMITVDEPDLKLCRMGLSERQGDVTTLRFEYLIGTRERIERAEETHRLLLTEPDDLAQRFADAGLFCTYDPEGLSGRGLFVARAG